MYAGFPSSQGIEVGGQSKSNFLASTVIRASYSLDPQQHVRSWPLGCFGRFWALNLHTLGVQEVTQIWS